MVERDQDKLYATTLQTIGSVSRLPMVRVDRESFLRKQFASSPHLDTVLAEGPQVVFTPESLRRMADGLITGAAAKSSAASFAAGLPANPALMVAVGGVDVAQYFGFAINLAQQIAYLFGEDDLLDGTGEIPEEAQIRIIAYMGAMFGAAGAATLVRQTSKLAGANLGKKVAAQALTKTAWYPVVKKVGALVGQKITKKTVEKTITKAVPILGGVVSGALTWATFRPMGSRLADVLVTNLQGGYDVEMELNPAYRGPRSVVIEGELVAESSGDRAVGGEDATRAER